MDEDARLDLRSKIKEQTDLGAKRLTQMRAEVRPLKNQIYSIKPRDGHSVAIVATDGGGSTFQFDPFMIQAVRVASSDDKMGARCLDIISSETEPAELLKKQYDPLTGAPVTPLTRMMELLKVNSLHALCSTIPERLNPNKPPAAWASFYREFLEWAVLLELASTRWGTDTVIIFDGLLRAKKFKGNLFADYLAHLDAALAEQRQKRGRSVFVVGFCRQNQVLTRYRLVMAAEKILTGRDPAYVPVPIELEANVFKWPEWYRREDPPGVIQMNGGIPFFAKLGDQPYDPIWVVDLLRSQADDVQTVMGHLLRDAAEGFPVACYPRTLQSASETAAMVDLDQSLLEHEVSEGVRAALGSEADVFDACRFQGNEPAVSG